VPRRPPAARRTARTGSAAGGGQVSAEVKDLVEGLLHPDQDQRLGCRAGGVEDIKRHPWCGGPARPRPSTARR
jgi:hypothetical protein